MAERAHDSYSERSTAAGGDADGQAGQQPRQVADTLQAGEIGLLEREDLTDMHTAFYSDSATGDDDAPGTRPTG